MFSGASGPLNGADGVVGAMVDVVVAANDIGAEVTIGAASVSGLNVGLGVESAKPKVLGDCRVETELVEFDCSAGVVETVSDELRDDSFGTSVAGALVDVPVSADDEPPPTVVDGGGVKTTGSALGVVDPDCAPPVLCATPAGTVVVDEPPSGVLPAVDDVDGAVDVDPVDEESVDVELPEEVLDVVPAADDELDVPDEELDVPDDEPESVGAASATPGMVATAEPTPNATANAPTRPM